MEISVGQVVKALAGRDKGRFFLVLDTDKGFALITDGKTRPLERPKRKNVKHLALTKTILPIDPMATNRKIRKALSPFNADMKEHST